jgi:hypothetical protein
VTKRPAKPAPDDLAQSQRFIDAAKEAGVDESGKGFEQAFKRLAPPKRRKSEA